LQKYITELYKRKDLLLYLVTSGLKAQHRNSFLGYFWWLLDPLLGVLIYFFVVVVIFQRGGEGYGIYLVVGMIVWRWLSSATGSASRSIIAQAGIIKQVYLPKAIFPLSATITQLINFLFGLLVIAVFMLFSQVVPGIQLLWLPCIVFLQALFLIAMTLVMAYICVFIRDIDTLVSHLLRLWFFGSPVIWSKDMVPDKFYWFLDINPMAYFLTGYRDVIIYNSTPDISNLMLIGLVSVIVIFAMMCVYSMYEHKIIKIL
jgi:ABC-type polysaccharide/polyol phosphate export permease